jgi:GDPmannose 4,6-dehydratase
MTDLVAVITGVTGQDGSYLAEFLLEKGYHVHGLLRRTSNVPTERIELLVENRRFHLHYCDVSDSQNVHETLRTVEKISKHPPNEIYNLAAQSDVQVSFVMPHYTSQVDAMGTLNILNAIKEMGWIGVTKFYQASASEMFGSSPPPQSETTPFHPRSPYAVAKLYAYWMTVHYREAYGMFAVNGILFNHESPRRGLNFVTRKVTRGVGKILRKEKSCLFLGNLSSCRDWGHAKDYVQAMWLMLQQPKPRDLVIGTGIKHSIRDLVVKAFQCVKIDIVFEGAGEDEVGIDKKTRQVVVRVDKKYFRPTEVENFLADPSRAKKILGWKPTYTFDTLIEEMVEHDCKQSQHTY